MVEVNLLAVIAIGAVLLMIHRYVSKKYEYFLAKPIPCLKPSFLGGSTGATMLRRQDIKSTFKMLYGSYPEFKVVGFYDLLKPIYLLRDPEVIKKITIKDFDYFTDHTPILAHLDEVETDSVVSNSLFLLRGQKWRDMRATLSPAFTGSKMRHMFELVAECAQSMAEFYKSEVKSGKKAEYEMKDTFSRCCIDLIASVAFGIKVDSLREQENEFFMKSKRILNFLSLSTMLKFLLMRAAPTFAQKLGIDIVDFSLVKYFKAVIVENMKQRNAHGIVRNDMVQMLMEVQKGNLKHQKDEQDTKDGGYATVQESQVGKSVSSRVWTESELTAQCFLFFLAGFDTVSNSLTFLTYELTINPEIQQRLYEEIVETDQSLNGKPLSYDVLQRMQYMDMVVSESLRKWPPLVMSDRFCVKDYLYDDGTGNRFVIERGQTVWLPLMAIQHDPKYYPNPDKFDPERFNEENKPKINAGAYLPFGVGPRNCTGSRLALMKIKVIVYYLLKDFSLEPTEKIEVPLRLAKNWFNLKAENGVWLEFKPREA